jgi:hypothetical protein
VGDFVLRTQPTANARISRTEFEYSFDVEIENRGPAASTVVATPASGSSATHVISLSVDFGAVARDARAVGDGSFVMRHDRRVPFDPSAISWQISAEVARDEAGFEIDPPGAWYAGDLHVHATGASNDTSPPGNSFPENIAAVARQRGLFFVVLTDHSNSTGSDVDTTFEDPALFNRGPEFPYWDRAAELTVPREFLMIDGNELSPRDPGILPTGHINCIPPDLEHFDRSGAFVDRPMGTVNGAATIAQARARGCYVIINHSYSFQPHIAFDWTSFDYDAIEVWNGGLGIGLIESERYAHDAWRCDLLAGRNVTPIAASDVHRVFTAPPGVLSAPALGWPNTAVFATEPTWPAIMDGLRKGNVSLRGGESRLYLDGYDGRRARAEDRTARELRLRGRLDPAAPPARLVLTRATACNDPRPALTPPTLTEETLLDVTVQPGETIERAIAIQGEPGVYSAKLLPSGATQAVHHAALTRAVVIR